MAVGVRKRAVDCEYEEGGGGMEEEGGAPVVWFCEAGTRDSWEEQDCYSKLESLLDPAQRTATVMERVLFATPVQWQVHLDSEAGTVTRNREPGGHGHKS
eukprot:2202787-Rhodomonas_salina.5